MSLMGGVLGTTLVCLFPLLIYVKEYRQSAATWIVALEGSAVVLGWIGGIYS